MLRECVEFLVVWEAELKELCLVTKLVLLDERRKKARLILVYLLVM